MLESLKAWRDEALCAQIGGDQWFPEDNCWGTEAKKICEKCPVQFDCLQFALDNNEVHGIWGGMSVNQRKELMKRESRAVS